DDAGDEVPGKTKRSYRYANDDSRVKMQPISVIFTSDLPLPQELMVPSTISSLHTTSASKAIPTIVSAQASSSIYLDSLQGASNGAILSLDVSFAVKDLPVDKSSKKDDISDYRPDADSLSNEVLGENPRPSGNSSLLNIKDVGFFVPSAADFEDVYSGTDSILKIFDSASLSTDDPNLSQICNALAKLCCKSPPNDQTRHEIASVLDFRINIAFDHI
ncbi:hypothetical protein MKW98_025648, partial [Papaver atlanticum]